MGLQVGVPKRRMVLVYMYGAEHLKSTTKVNLIARIKFIEFTMGNSFYLHTAAHTR